MTRQITRQIEEGEPHRDKVIKLIPAEIVAAYLLMQANLIELGQIVIWVVIVILFIITFLYLRFFGKVTNKLQLMFSTLSFLVWVFSIAPREILDGFYRPQLASVVLVLWTLLIPFFVKGEPSLVDAKGTA